ncbi:DUF2637 domain-containing protein [Saccharothrix syringae]|uniref:DUF2637 domain-containing protein n=1 Tax=Saccharothrix syringae TaxID=103733 RepID=A0A5Q0GVN5_SACSY|nr:DUF2637 domain-containing protein [Saccharothrix syringae]QFZ17554.1 DUF2637 domain-containing protein [Saccharothrix syringae]
MSWAEERRADRVTAAEQRRADEVLRFEQRRADRAAAVEQRRAEKDAARARRAALVAAVAGWLRGHTLDLLFVPVIVVPAVLAWTAMAAYGREVFGPVGVLLPLFSEGAMWCFAFAVPMAQRAGRPTGWLHCGTWVFAAVAGGLNYVHGATVAHGVVMALVSVGGVVVHQLVTAAPARRRSRAERDAARLERQAARRVLAVRRAALRQAVAELAADGTATLVHRPGTVALRRRAGRTRLVPATVPGLPVAPVADGLGDELAAEVAAFLAAVPADAGNAGNRPGKAETSPEGVPAEAAGKVAEHLSRVRAAIADGRLPAAPSQAAVRRFLRCRAEHAALVHRALTGRGDDDSHPAVTA